MIGVQSGYGLGCLGIQLLHWGMQREESRVAPPLKIEMRRSSSKATTHLQRSLNPHTNPHDYPAGDRESPPG